MKALILAAGLGTRLAPITNDRPKSLVPVNGTPILFKQISNLLGCGVDDITVISGYFGDVLADEVHAKWPEVKVVHSADYATTNNMYSAWIARESFAGEPFVMMNADVFYDASVMAALLDCAYEDAIVCDLGTYNEESMKIIEADGRITHIAKDITPEEALGCSIDVYKFSAKGGTAFFEACDTYISRGELKLWSEVALDDALSKVEFRACPLDGRWLEIDNHDDLAAAERIFS